MGKTLKKTIKPGKNKIVVVGDGSWGTALVKSLRSHLQDVSWWVRNEETIDFVKKYNRNPDYLRSVDVNVEPERISTNITKLVKEAEIVLFAIPSLYFRRSVVGLAPDDLKNKVIISAIKGIIPNNDMLVSDYLKEHFKVDEDKFVFLTGPSHSEEVANKRMTFITLASKSRELAEEMAVLFDNSFIKIRTSDDVEGLEYAAILKNIYAIAMGICHSMGYGDNYQAVFASNAIREMEQFLNQICPAERDIKTSGYLGDLMVTSFSQFSRNRTFGGMIGRGYSTRSALLEMNMIPEGYFAVHSFFRILKKRNLDMKIVKAIYRILYQKTPPAEEFQKLEEYFI